MYMELIPLPSCHPSIHLFIYSELAFTDRLYTIVVTKDVKESKRNGNRSPQKLSQIQKYTTRNEEWVTEDVKLKRVMEWTCWLLNVEPAIQGVEGYFVAVFSDDEEGGIRN